MCNIFVSLPVSRHWDLYFRVLVLRSQLEGVMAFPWESSCGWERIRSMSDFSWLRSVLSVSFYHSGSLLEQLKRTDWENRTVCARSSKRLKQGFLDLSSSASVDGWGRLKLVECRVPGKMCRGLWSLTWRELISARWGTPCCYGKSVVATLKDSKKATYSK